MAYKKFFKILAFSMWSTAACASSLPQAPSLDNLANGDSCRQYALAVSDYFDGLEPQSTNQLSASIWFQEFAASINTRTINKKCSDNECRIEFYKGSSGCYIASTAEGHPLMQLLEQLQAVYYLAINDQFVGPVTRYGLEGDEATCSPDNNYIACNLIQ